MSSVRQTPSVKAHEFKWPMTCSRGTWRLCFVQVPRVKPWFDGTRVDRFHRYHCYFLSDSRCSYLLSVLYCERHVFFYSRFQSGTPLPLAPPAPVPPHLSGFSVLFVDEGKFNLPSGIIDFISWANSFKKYTLR